MRQGENERVTSHIGKWSRETGSKNTKRREAEGTQTQTRRRSRERGLISFETLLARTA